MRNYRLTEEAREDLIRIYKYGVKKFGENQAEKYFNGFFDLFDFIADNPFSYPAIDFIRAGYRRSPYGSDGVYYHFTDHKVTIVAIVGQST
jgi:toxin ParE1/3/4